MQLKMRNLSKYSPQLIVLNNTVPHKLGFSHQNILNYSK
jgi:hypothetical protein